MGRPRFCCGPIYGPLIRHPFLNPSHYRSMVAPTSTTDVIGTLPCFWNLRTKDPYRSLLFVNDVYVTLPCTDDVPIIQSRLKSTACLSPRRPFHQYHLVQKISIAFSNHCLPRTTASAYYSRRRIRSPPLHNYNQVLKSLRYQCSAS